MNKYTFTYYGYIPAYGDFDQEWIDIESDSEENARILLNKMGIISKDEPVLVSINDVEVITNKLRYK